MNREVREMNVYRKRVACPAGVIPALECLAKGIGCGAGTLR